MAVKVHSLQKYIQGSQSSPLELAICLFYLGSFEEFYGVCWLVMDCSIFRRFLFCTHSFITRDNFFCMLVFCLFYEVFSMKGIIGYLEKLIGLEERFGLCLNLVFLFGLPVPRFIIIFFCNYSLDMILFG